MTQARHEYSARRGQESYEAETVDSVSGLFEASKNESLQVHDSASIRDRIRRSRLNDSAFAERLLRALERTPP
jgi:hypothetical protein